MSFNTSDPESEDIVAEINMTPLIDIMLVLLIIFMVTSSVSVESGLDIDLPKTSSKTQATAGEAVIISLGKDGQLSIAGKIFDGGDMKAAIANAMAEAKTEFVVFEGDKTAQIGRAIEIMDVAKEAGAKKFAIAAENPK
ncbi:MAG: ExbD/TolR family protein [Bacteriovoracaceae bacterium]